MNIFNALQFMIFYTLGPFFITWSFEHDYLILSLFLLGAQIAVGVTLALKLTESDE